MSRSRGRFRFQPAGVPGAGVTTVINVLGAFNFPAFVTVAIDVGNVLEWKQPLVPASVVDASVARLLSGQDPAAEVVTNVSGVLAPVDIDPGAAVANRSSGTVKELAAGGSVVVNQTSGIVKSDQEPTGRVSRIIISLDHTSYVVTATQDPGGDWENIDNSEDAPDGAEATLEGGLVLGQGTLRGAFADFSGKPESLEISQVVLTFRVRIAGLTLLEQMTLGYRVGDLGTPHNLETITANTGGLVDRVHDITAALDGVGGEGLSWDTMTDLQSFVTANAVVDSLVVHAVDSVELHIEAAEITVERIGWWRSDQGLTLVSGAVSDWADVSGNGHTLGQTTAASRPTYRASGGPNDRAYLEFDGVDDFIEGAVERLQPYHLFLVLRPSRGAVTNGDTILDGAATNAGRLYLSSATQLVATSTGLPGESVLTGTVDTADWHLVEVRFNGASSAIVYDGDDEHTGDAGDADTTELILGALGSGSTANCLDMDLAEVQLFGDIIDGDYRDCVIQNINRRYRFN